MSGSPPGLGARDAPRSRVGVLRASVVICAYTQVRWSQLERAVESVHAQTCPAAELIVVVDHNPALLEQARVALRARVVPNRQVRGLSGARNTGLALAEGDVVVFLDDDAYAETDWLERLLAPYDDPSVVVVGGQVIAAFDDRRPAFLPPEFDWVVGCSYRGLPAETADVRNVIGASMSVRRSVFATAGGFEVSLGRIGDRPLGCEETEFCIRAAAATPGGRVVHEPAARVHHQVPSSRAGWRYFRSRCWAEGLSKAAVARLAGSSRGLSSERTYVTRTLPVGILDGLHETLRTGRASGVLRAGAIIVGVGITTAGYLVASFSLRRTKPQAASKGPVGDRPDVELRDPGSAVA